MLSTWQNIHNYFHPGQDYSFVSALRCLTPNWGKSYCDNAHFVSGFSIAAATLKSPPPPRHETRHLILSNHAYTVRPVDVFLVVVTHPRINPKITPTKQTSFPLQDWWLKIAFEFLVKSIKNHHDDLFIFSILRT